MLESKNYKTLETDCLLIRPMQIIDAEFFLELINTPKWLKYIGDRKVKTLKDSEEYIKVKMLPQLERLGYGNNIVIRKEDGIPVASCGLYDREGLEGIDIGYAVLPQFEGKGYAFESVSRLKKVAFEDFGIQKINAITLPENEASKNLLIKLGFTFQKMVQIPNDPVELMFFSVNSVVRKTKDEPNNR